MVVVVKIPPRSQVLLVLIGENDVVGDMHSLMSL